MSLAWAQLARYLIHFPGSFSYAIPLVLCPSRYGLGRGSESAEETAWLADAALAAIGRANDYLVSEHVGDASLLDLARDLL